MALVDLSKLTLDVKCEIIAKYNEDYHVALFVDGKFSDVLIIKEK